MICTVLPTIAPAFLYTKAMNISIKIVKKFVEDVRRILGLRCAPMLEYGTATTSRAAVGALGLFYYGTGG